MVDVYTRNPSLASPPVQIAAESDSDSPYRCLMNESCNGVFGADNDWQSLQGSNALITLPYVSVVKLTFWSGGPLVWRMGGSYSNTTANNAQFNWQLQRDDGTNILPSVLSMAAITHDAAGDGSFWGRFELHPFSHSDHTWEQWLYYKFLVRAKSTTADQVFEGRMKCAQSFASDVRLNWTFQKQTVDGSVTFRELTCVHENARSGS